MIRTLFRSALVALLVATGFAVAQPHVPAGAATFTVTDTADDVLTPNTLRWAIEQANNDAGAPVIEIASGLAIDLTCAGGGTLVYDNTTDQPLTIEGNGATITQTCAASAVLSTASEDVTVRTTTITGGTSSGILSNGDVLIEDSVVEGNSGGGVTAYTGTATIVRSTLADNSGGAGGGVGAIHVVVEDSTLAGNDASTGGGAWADQTATVVNSTVSGNTATVSGGGVYAGLNEIDLTYSTIVGNTSPLAANVQLDFSAMITSFATIIGEPQGGGADCDIDIGATITSLGYNVTSDSSCGFDSGPGDLPDTDAQVGSLADNGGPTATRLPASGSPAIDRADCSVVAITADQRGVSRPQGPACDSGSVEVEVGGDGPGSDPATPGTAAATPLALTPRFTG
jgi:hypothetical protein